MQQFIFDLKRNENYKLEDYIICKSNLQIINYLNKWPNWGDKPNNRVVVIHGSAKSGKTHLAYIWNALSKAKFINYNDIHLDNNIAIVNLYNCFIIDDIENLIAAEINLLHFINLITEQKKYLLITSQNHLENLPLKLVDLKSRLNSFLEFRLPEIDDELFKLIAFKYFTDRHVVVNDKIINFMLNRVDRSFTSLKQIINMIDRKALVEKRSVSVNLIRQILENI